MCHHVDDSIDEYYEQLTEKEATAESDPPEHLNEDDPDVEFELLTDGGDE